MAEIAVVTRRVQIGPEATPGTNVAATTRLRTMDWTFSPQFDTRDFRATGDKYGTVVQPLREWCDFTAEGVLDFNESIYGLASVVNYSGTPSVAGTTAAGTAYNWLFESALDAPDTPITYTVENGDANRAQVTSYVLFNQFDITVSQQEASFSGGGFAHRWEDGSAMTAATAIASPDLANILPSFFKVYIDPTPGAVGTTQLRRAFNIGYSLSERYGPVWPVDSDNTSYAAHVELPANLTMTLQVAADGTGLALLDDMRLGNTKFIRLEAIGGTTVGGSNYKFALDFAGEIMDAPDMSDFEGVYAAQWTFRGVYNPTFGKAFSVFITNEMASL